MDLTTSGRFRVLESPRAPSKLLLVDVAPEDPEAPDAYEPTVVDAAGYGEPLASTVADLEPGNVAEATLAWDAGTARFTDLSVVRRSVVAFADDVTGVFEAATETWEAAVADGAGMNSRVTYDTDGEANGVLYVFAEQSGARDVFEEFRTGALPLEPLLARVNQNHDAGEREVFVMRPVDHPFVLVYIALRKGGLLAETVRDTYDVG
ncbi:MAG: DUF6663 family protein [Haloferacaceae archaeon]